MSLFDKNEWATKTPIAWIEQQPMVGCLAGICITVRVQLQMHQKEQRARERERENNRSKIPNHGDNGQFSNRHDMYVRAYTDSGASFILEER